MNGALTRRRELLQVLGIGNNGHIDLTNLI
jgi:6-phosphogluconolactonase/glucosamine-6-phosphate isomerase/deaminase